MNGDSAFCGKSIDARLALNNDYNMLMSSLQVSVSKHLLDDEFTVIWANDFYYKSIEYTKEEYEAEFSNSVKKYYRNNLAEYKLLSAIIIEAIERGEPSYTCVTSMPTRSGKLIWIRIVGTFTNEVIDGKQVIYSVFTNITDLINMRAEQSITFNSIPGFIAKFRVKPGFEFEFIDCNDKFIEFFGKRGPEDPPYCIGNCADAKNRQIVYSHYDDMRAGKPVSFVLRVKDRSGGDAWLKINGDCIDNRTVDPIYLFVYIDITDITEQRVLQKKLEDQAAILQSALESAEKANKAKSDFLSRMSHDIRTPMNAIIGMTTIAKSSLGNPERMLNCLEKVEVSAKFLLSLINDILDMSKIESGKMALNKHDFDLADCIRDITLMFMTEAQKKGITFDVLAETPMLENYFGDELKLKQILINLLGNSIKFTDKGGSVRLKMAIGNMTAQSSELIFTVEDNGIGMDEEFISRIFRPFEQNSDQNKYGGSGLGLAIAQNFAKMMNGSIEVRSTKGVGSRFTVRVWLDNTQNDGILKCFDDVNVVIAESNEIALRYAADLVKKFGIHAAICSEEQEALKALDEIMSRDGYHLLVTSWNIRGSDGETLIRRARSKYGTGDLVIAVNAFESESIRAVAVAAGADLLVPRPMFPSAVNDMLMEITGGKRLETFEEYDNITFDGQRVLLVEDNDINVEIARIMLENCNLTVEVARNGREAVDMFTQNPDGWYSLILMDIQMPIMNGFEATEAIRNADRADAATVPIVAMSANAFDEDVQKSLDCGMNAHISKPVDIKILHDKLGKIIK